MKLETAIKIATTDLNKNKIDSSILDTEILMSKVINRDRGFVILNPKEDIKENNYS